MIYRDFAISLGGALVFWVIVGVLVTLARWAIGYFVGSRPGRRLPLPWQFAICGPVGWVCAAVWYGMSR